MHPPSVQKGRFLLPSDSPPQLTAFIEPWAERQHRMLHLDIEIVTLNSGERSCLLTLGPCSDRPRLRGHHVAHGRRGFGSPGLDQMRAVVMFRSSFHRPAVTLILTAICTTLASAERRTWTDSTGKFSVKAELLELKDDSVVLKKDDGATATVPLARLSAADREYLRAVAKPGEPLPNDKGPKSPLVFSDALTEPPSWNDQNVPFDLAEFLRVPAVDKNAAFLYLGAFVEFSWSEMSCFFPEMSEQEQKERYLAASKLSDEQERLEDAWEKDPKSVDPAAVDAWLANFDAGFEKLAAAQERPQCIFQTGRSLTSLIPHAHVVRQVARVVRWRIRRDIQRGDLERPLQDLSTLLRLTHDLRVRSGMVAQLVAIAVDDQRCDLVRTILNAPGIEVEQCDQLLTLLVTHEANAIDPFVEGNRAEYIHCRQAIHDLQHRTGTFDPKSMRDELGMEGNLTSPLACFQFFLDLSGGARAAQSAKMAAALQAKLLPGAWTGGKMLSDDDYAKEVQTLNDFFTSILALADQQTSRRQEVMEIEAAEDPVLKTTLLARMVIPAEVAFVNAICRSKARLRGTQCLVALRRWQLEHTDEAPDLETLVKAAGMTSIPIDPYSGKPLRMGSDVGKQVIYSVGPDGKDDKAEVEWNWAQKGLGDFIFRLETPSP
jgi:hypothetical protein